MAAPGNNPGKIIPAFVFVFAAFVPPGGSSPLLMFAAAAAFVLLFVPGAVVELFWGVLLKSFFIR